MVCGVVACKDNNKAGGCSDGCIAGSDGCKVVVVVWVLVVLEDRERDGERERTLSQALPR